MRNTEYRSYVAFGVTAVAVCLFVKYFKAVLSAISIVLTAAAPLLLGCVIAYVLNILLKKIEKVYFPGTANPWIRKSRRPVCIVLSLLFLLIIMLFIINLVVPELISSIRLITDEIPPLVEEVRAWAISHSENLPTMQDALENVNVNWQDMVKKMVDFVLSGAGGFFNSVFAVLMGVFGRLAQLLIGLIFAIYLLSCKEQIKAQIDRVMRAYLKPTVRKRILYVAGVLHETFSSFITGQCMEAVIIGALCAGGMMLFRMPYAVMTGAVVGVTALIPVVGAYIGAVVGAFMVFTVNPLQAVFFIIFLVVLQQLEGNLIYPKVVGSSIGLPGIWVLAAVTVGGGVLGIGGMLLGVPLAASIYKLTGNEVSRRLSGRDRS